jgi:TPR repeat protein
MLTTCHVSGAGAKVLHHPERHQAFRPAKSAEPFVCRLPITSVDFVSNSWRLHVPSNDRHPRQIVKCAWLLAVTLGVVASGGECSAQAIDIATIKERARQGTAEDQARLGWLLLSGTEIERNPSEAFEWFSKAAEQGNAAGRRGMARVYITGEAVPKDVRRGVSILTTAAEQGDAEAQHELGKLYIDGEVVKADRQKAMRWLGSAAEKNFVPSFVCMGQLLSAGVKSTQNASAAANWFAKSAENGDPMGEYLLGLAHERGDGVQQDYALAVRWYEKAARDKRVGEQANVRLAGLLLRGNGIAKDIVRGRDILRRAVLMGNADAMLMIADMYAQGLDGPVNQESAFMHYVEAGEAGSAEGQYKAGMSCLAGVGTAKSAERAFEWFLQAGKKGHLRSQTFLAAAYRDGLGTRKDLAESAKWWTKAAFQGDAESQFQLGRVYADGSGVTQSDATSFGWFTIAAENKHADASVYAQGLRARMSEQQIEEGQRFAKAYQQERATE